VAVAISSNGSRARADDSARQCREGGGSIYARRCACHDGRRMGRPLATTIRGGMSVSLGTAVGDENLVRRAGELVRLRRIERGVTQGELARKAKLGRAYLSRIESLKALPSDTLLKRIATALGDKDPEPYLRARRTETVVEPDRVVAKTRAARHKIEYTNLEYLLSVAQVRFQYRGFSALHFLQNQRDNLAQFANQGGVIQVILAEPTLPNLYWRAIDEGGIEDIEHVRNRMWEQHHKLMIAFGKIEEVRRYYQRIGVFDLFLDPSYERKRRWTIVDGRFCVLVKYEDDSDNFKYQVFTEDDPELKREQERFLAKTREPEAQLDWEVWRSQWEFDPRTVTEETIKKIKATAKRACRRERGEIARTAA